MKRTVATRHILRNGILAFVVIAYSVYVYASSTGIIGRTQKNGAGCTCHGSSPSSNVIVAIEGPDTLAPTQTAKYTVTISGGPAAAAGTNIAASQGVLTAVSATLKKVGDELTHNAPVLFEASNVTFSFQYTAPDTDGIQTLYANGNSVDNTGSQFFDEWNFAPSKQIVIHTLIPPTTTTVHDTVRAVWNLISLPVGVSNPLKDSVFSHSISHAFAYNNGYVIHDTLLPGRGYWLKFDSVRVVELSGAIVATESIDVVDSWNLIGSISTSVPVSSLSSDPPGLIVSSVYGYDGNYSPAGEIKPGKGYWVKTGGSGKIIITQSLAAPKSSSASVNDIGRMNSLTIIDRLGRFQTLYFGMSDELHTRLTYFELPPSPPAGVFDVRFSSQRMLEVVEKKAVREFPITISSAEYPLSVSWKLSTSAITASLTGSGSSILLAGEGSAEITNPGEKLLLKLSTASGQEKFALSPGFPNPFNPTISISYELPLRSSVSVNVYDILGKEVRTLIAGELPPGTHIARWDGNAKDGAASPSGMYLVKMIAIPAENAGRPFTASQKIMLLK